MNVGVLPVQVSVPFLQDIFTAIEKEASTIIRVDLPRQIIKILSTGRQESFAINEYKKQNLLNGFDDIDYLQNIKQEIRDFANQRLF